MDPIEFIDTRTKRYMAQALEQFEDDIEKPLRAAAGASEGQLNRDLSAILARADSVKRTFRKRLQALASDAKDIAREDLDINAFEPVRR